MVARVGVGLVAVVTVGHKVFPTAKTQEHSYPEARGGRG